MGLIKSSLEEGKKYENLIEDNLYSFDYLKDIQTISIELYNSLKILATNDYVVFDKKNFIDKFTQLNYILRKIDLANATILKYSYLVPYGKQELNECKYGVEKKIITKFVGEPFIKYEIMPELSGSAFPVNFDISLLNLGIKKQFDFPLNDISDFIDIDDIIIKIKNNNVGIDRYFSVAKKQAAITSLNFNEVENLYNARIELSNIFTANSYKNELDEIDVYDPAIFANKTLYDVQILFVHTYDEYEIDEKLSNYVILDQIDLNDILIAESEEVDL